jgi:predicted ATPase
MGKTRLAVEVGRALAAASPATLPDGVWFVPLAPVHSAGGIVSAIAGALGLTLQGGDPSRVLLQGLQGQRLLLILDNFEQLLPAESGARDLVAAILAAAPGVQMLVTSRARLKFHAEHVYPVPPLAYGAAGMPEAAASPAAGAAPLAVGGPAVSLFVAAAQRVQRDFALTTATLPAVLRICALVQGMPLGLELAAAHAGSLPLDAIADAIAAGAGFLAADWPDVPPRHRSMAAVFGWSWQLLSPEEQRVLRRLAVFDGGFTYAAAEAVAGATRTLLAQLIDKSLLQWQPNAGPEGRYALHELLRQFAAAELEAAGEHQVLAAEHGRYFLAFLAECGRRLGRDEPAEASAAVGRELDNVRGAWQWAAQTGDLGSLDLAAYGWWQYCQFGDQAAEGRESLALAVAGVRRALVQIAAAGADPAWGQRVLAKLLALHANYLFAQGCDEEMDAQAQEAIALGAAAGGVEGETFGTFVLGRALQELDRKDAAMAAWENTVELARRYTATHGDCELLYEAHWMAHTWLQGSALHFGDYHGSRAHMVAALDLCRTLGKRWAELYCLGCLAGLDYHLFDFAAAEEGFVAALAQARALGYRRVEMGALDGLAGVLRLRGVYQEARMLLEEAVALARELVFPYDEALSLAALVRLHCQLGDAGAAAEVLEQLTYLLARVKLAKECRLYGRLAAAAVASAAGDPQVARRCAEEAAAINQRGGDILFRLVDTALILGHAALAAGAWAEAAGAFAEALAAFDLLARPALAAEPRAGLAAVALAEGNLPAALAHVERILPTLAQVPRCGYNDPYFVYETCRRVLAAAGDSRAGAVLQRGYDLLQADAATLDDGRRHRFLTAVSDHRALVAAYAQRHVFPE